VEETGVHWVGRTSESTPISVAIPAERDRGFITVDPLTPPDLETLSTIQARAVVANLPNIAALPKRPGVYAIIGDPEAAALAGKMTESLAHLEALFLNEREASILMRMDDPEGAARSLSELGTTVVMTRGHAGAMAISPTGEVSEVAAPALEVPDPTGAGDAFTAAYIWSNLRGDPLEQRVRNAVLYASQSIGCASSRQKGLSLQEFQTHLSNAACS
jgi:sugar/nucleoside kinase (ribokinase family)